MGRIIRAAALAATAIAIATAPVSAQQSPKPPPKDSLTEQTEEAFRKTVETILKALEKLADSVPIYEAPEVLENGDIIIRRKKRDTPDEDLKKDKAPDGTSST